MSLETALWAKTSLQAGGLRNPVYIHLTDCALVAQVIVHALPRSLQSKVMQIFTPMAPKGALDLLSLIAAGHDLGKVSPDFQAMVEEAKRQLIFLGFKFGPVNLKRRHDKLSRTALEDYLKDLGLSREAADRFASISSGHHGRFYSYDGPLATGDAWANARMETMNRVASILGIDLADLKQECPKLLFEDPDPGPLLVLMGVISVADWISSNEAVFPFEPGEIADIEAWVRERQELANEAVDRLHLYSPAPSHERQLTFNELFGVGDPTAGANQVQEATRAMAAASPDPMLIIVETPTGSGKTEAAELAYFERLRFGPRGLYYGLPTQTTGNMMFDRVRTFLSAALPDQDVEYHLLHADAFLYEAYKELRISWTDPQDTESSLVATDWFSGAKRGLLATHGVGTIDQALLAVTTNRHFFVRLFGLAGKVVILDEVHAYDVYMKEILLSLVRWLSALDCTVILLSATLGKNWRTSLVQAFDPAQLAFHADYPAVVGLRRGQAPEICHIDGDSMRRSYALELCPSPFQEWARGMEARAIAEAGRGGCVLCICNTVDGAQELYRRIRDSSPGIEISLLHSRFTKTHRSERERAVVEKFGPQGIRPRGAIVVSSQVVEQSLDLDFDILLTELCPVDLLIQRLGRVHRHRRTNRSLAFEKANAVVYCPEEFSELCFGNSGFVYEPICLARSLIALRELGSTLDVPQDVEKLIEAVYGDDACIGPAEKAQLFDKWSKDADGVALAEQYTARGVVLPNPRTVADDWEALINLGDCVDGDTYKRTRLGPESITLAILDEAPQLPSVPEYVRSVREASLQFSKRAWMEGLKALLPCRVWEKNGVLRDIVPLVFVDGVCHVQQGCLAYDAELGLHILEGGN